MTFMIEAQVTAGAGFLRQRYRLRCIQSKIVSCCARATPGPKEKAAAGVERRNERTLQHTDAESVHVDGSSFSQFPAQFPLPLSPSPSPSLARLWFCPLQHSHLLPPPSSPSPLLEDALSPDRLRCALVSRAPFLSLASLRCRRSPSPIPSSPDGVEEAARRRETTWQRLRKT